MARRLDACGNYMKTLVTKLGLLGNPFEHYTAETEPNIADYAVRPPYLQAISERVNGLSTFILFGDRGAGKSATRITVFNEIWKRYADANTGKTLPFVVNLTDYSRIEHQFKKGKFNERDIVNIVAFAVLEQLLAWLASMNADDRAIFVEGLNAAEKSLSLALLQGFYLNVGEIDRSVSTEEALRLLNSAWSEKSRVWATQRWDSLSKILASVVSALSKKSDIPLDVAAPAESLLKSLIGDAPNVPRAILGRLTDLVRAFGFSGIVVLVDKVDEIQATANSAEATASLIHPLLAQIQLLEVNGFSWIFFLWSKVKDHFEGKTPVRLDKIAHATISWNQYNLRELIEARVRFFSEGRLSFADLLADDLDPDDVFSHMCTLALTSPRELIKLFDTVFREHDALGEDAGDVIDNNSLTIGLNKYAVETIGRWFNPRHLQQVLRLGQVSFVNSDVQFAFKIGDQGARNKIKVWQDAGLVVQNGTAQSELGGKHVFRFQVADARVERIITRRLVDAVGAQIDEAFEEYDEALLQQLDETVNKRFD